MAGASRAMGDGAALLKAIGVEDLVRGDLTKDV
jgi:hypothetical protein